jgi:tetratricopeptide (TPR) repeat protein
MIMLSLKRYFLEQELEADTMLARLQRIYPKSVLVNYLSAFQYRFGGQLDQSQEYWQKLYDHVEFSPQVRGTTRYQIGYVCFLKSDWATAAKAYEDFLAQPLTSTGQRFRPYTCFQLGFCYWKLNQTEKIEEVYRRLPEWFRAHESYDVFAKRKVDKFLTTKEFTRKEEIVIVSGALNEGKMFRKALDGLEELYSISVLANDREGKAHFHYLKGQALAGLKEFDEAKEQLRLTLMEEAFILEEKHIVPYSYTLLAEIAIEEGAFQQAQHYLDKVKKYKGYDWERILTFRLYADSQRLERRMKLAVTGGVVG